MIKLLSHFFIPHNFLGIPKPFSDYRKSEFVILPVPYEQTTTYKAGTREGPSAIINASAQVELYDEELGFEPYRKGICTLDSLSVTSLGPERMNEIIYETSKELIHLKKKVVMLGGEHSISWGLVKAYKERYPGLSVLQLDAHADLRDEYQENKFNHACIMRRIRELVPSVQVGIRNLSQEEAEYIKGQKKLPIFYAKDMASSDEWMDEAIALLSDEVYLTFDLDFLDPSIMPAVGTPEPGGILWYPTLTLLRKLATRKKIVGFDVVELSPLPGMVAPDFLAAKLVYKLISYIVEQEKI
ncbi:MAG: agmatinase [candidate division Zixibacteria bacterium]|nr:agmatinase [candidate division Zixibacteria bacterium]